MGSIVYWHRISAMGEATVLQSATKAASLNVILQFLFRLTTFALNAIVVNVVDPAVLGVANVRLYALYTAGVFMSREAFRKACAHHHEDDWHKVVNIVWLSIPTALLVTLPMACIWLWVLEAPDVPNYNAAVAITVVSVLVEMLSEPAFVLAQLRMQVTVRVVAEGSAMLMRALGVLGLLYVRGDACSVLDLALAQLLFSSAYTVLTVMQVVWSPRRAHAGRRQRAPSSGTADGGAATPTSTQTTTTTLPGAPDSNTSATGLGTRTSSAADPGGSSGLRALLPRMARRGSLDAPLWHGPTLSLVGQFLRQGVLKHVLTEGENLVLTAIVAVPFAEQGVYDVVNNLGSLAARFVFQPVEEAFYLYFAKTVPRGMRRPSPPATLHAQAAACDEQAEAARALSALIKGMALLGLTIAVFGQAYAHVLLALYGGPTLATNLALSLMRLYSVYVLLMALNGVTECFVFAVAPQPYLDRYNGIMVGITALFLAAALVLVPRMGSPGMLIANCVNMALRIAHHLVFIARYYHAHSSAHEDARTATPNPLKAALPHPLVLAAYLVAAATTVTSLRVHSTAAAVVLPFSRWTLLVANAQHLGLGVAALVCCLAAILRTEPQVTALLMRIVHRVGARFRGERPKTE